VSEFSRSVLRSGKILLQKCATLCNALRKRNYELPSNDMQSSETLRNSLGLNYKSAALSTELCRRSHTKAVFSELIKSLHDPSRVPRCNGIKFHGLFLRPENGLGPRGAGGVVSHQDSPNSKLITVLENFSAISDLCGRRRAFRLRRRRDSKRCGDTR
jgi:hypothetical protein